MTKLFSASYESHCVPKLCSAFYFLSLYSFNIFIPHFFSNYSIPLVLIPMCLSLHLFCCLVLVSSWLWGGPESGLSFIYITVSSHRSHLAPTLISVLAPHSVLHAFMPTLLSMPPQTWHLLQVFIWYFLI